MSGTALPNLDLRVACDCSMCGKRTIVWVNQQDLEDWVKGKLIQDAMPYLSADIRELLISKTCPDCWKSLWNEDGDVWEETLPPPLTGGSE
jgi:hypothetical protein